MADLTKHYVEFLSPGTFFSETSLKEIDGPDVDKAVKMAREIVERHNARPYGFRFIVRGRKAGEMDSREISKSGIYFLGGEVRTAEQVLSGNDPDEHILRANVRINRYKAIVTNRNSYTVTMPLTDGDTVLDVKLPRKR